MNPNRRSTSNDLRDTFDGDPWIWKISEEVFRKLSKSWIGTTSKSI